MAVKPNSKYWQDRALDRFLEDEKKGLEYIKRINTAYNRANRNIQREIDEIYRVYSKGAGLDKQVLKELLTKSETDKFWKTAQGKGYKDFVKKNYKARITRLEKIQFQLYDHVKQVGVLDINEQAKLYQETLRNTYNKTLYDTAMGSGYDFSFNKLDTRTINKIMDNKWSGKNFSERIWTNTDILGEKLSDMLGGAVASGQSIEKTSRQLRETMNVGKYYSERLVRTEMNYFHNEAEYEAYKEMGVEEYEFVATLDMKTSKVCQMLDGEILNLKEKENGNNWPPLHPSCRSTIVAYFGDEYRSLQRRARNPITGKSELVENVSYKEWLAKQESKYGEQRISIQEKKVKNLTSDAKQHERYRAKLGKEVPANLDDFQELKYNKINDWKDLKEILALKKGYDKEILKSNIHPLTSFDLFKQTYNKCKINLLGLSTKNGIEIKSVSPHFVARTIGNPQKQIYKNLGETYRLGVPVLKSKNVILQSTDFMNSKNGDRTVIFGEKLQITLDPKQGRLIQTNPLKKRGKK